MLVDEKKTHWKHQPDNAHTRKTQQQTDKKKYNDDASAAAMDVEINGRGEENGPPMADRMDGKKM
jgi:hypothetical protein